jgi:cysteine synthase
MCSGGTRCLAGSIRWGLKGHTRFQGIGAGFIPGVLNRAVYDEIIRFKNDDGAQRVKRACWSAYRPGPRFGPHSK